MLKDVIDEIIKVMERSATNMELSRLDHDRLARNEPKDSNLILALRGKDYGRIF